MLSTNFPSEATLYRVEFAQTTNPLRPVLDDEVELQLTFLQSGPLSDATGDVWLVDAYGTILTQFESPDWDGESSVLQTVTITWPKGSTVALKAMWDIEETVVTEEVSYTSGQTVVESSTEWPLAPWYGVCSWDWAPYWSFGCAFSSNPPARPHKRSKCRAHLQEGVSQVILKKSERLLVQNVNDAFVFQSVILVRWVAQIVHTSLRLSLKPQRLRNQKKRPKKPPKNPPRKRQSPRKRAMGKSKSVVPIANKRFAFPPRTRVRYGARRAR